MIDKEERDSIINEAVEKMLLFIPDAIVKLSISNAIRNRDRAQLYLDNKEFIPHQEIVELAVKELESEHPAIDHSELMKLVPERVKQKLGLVTSLDVKTAEKPQNLSLNGVI